MARLKLLWITLKQLSTTHQSLIETKNQVTDQFKQLYDLFIIEEHKIYSILDDRVQQTSSIIHDIINEIKSINEIFRPSTTSTCVIDKVDGGISADITQTIRSCESLDQFIEQAFPTTSPGLNLDDSTMITNNELLTLLQRNVQMSTTSKYQLTRSIRLDIDTDTLDDIKKQIKSCFQLLEDSDKFTADLDHHVMCLGSGEYSMFSPMTNTWKLVNEKVIENIDDGTYKTFVYARGYVYMFGGYGDDFTTYSRFSLATREWQRSPMVGIPGGTYMTSCYDGDRHIYLLGGNGDDENVEDVALTRIACFDIDTQQFTHVGDFKDAPRADAAIIHSNVIYSIDSPQLIRVNEQPRIVIKSFNVVTKQEDEYTLMQGNMGSCVHFGHNKILKLLWTNLKQQSTTHQSLIETKNEVTDQFKQLYDLLIIEEHKINSILNDKVQQTSSTIHDIINEIKSINQIFRPSSTSTGVYKDNEVDAVITQTIRSCESLDQFIEQTFPTTSPGLNLDDSITITDNELLTLLQRNVQMSNSKHQLTRSIRVDTDTDTLDDIKKQIRSCFQLLEDSDNFTADLDHHLMCLDNGYYSLFSPMTNKWALVQDEDTSDVESTFQSTVYARGYIYVFGGYESDPAKYSRLSIATRELQRNMPIVGVSGGSFMSACLRW
ncbi:hypothetical protein SAMD00019534_050380 [Acytostelium subglobosum LB1]|uniref:hypothetical protein n=1 Tax=Acytostelium subglobosum LB1 TaxID=1410327 RepID=UPI0006450B4C|nr:hypothetical protein SAMD00019534_050380 [Acytostelium subglobosum LB1]GAM21863.1 hypothetical protein SAMD00019534_050380 [Acytostelium subglobosum LB1]|eukprot:XP_012754963.1 hypothetical protein SAMD00019534_050380 [Acytostelium subglobosum LB1]